GGPGQGPRRSPTPRRGLLPPLVRRAERPAPPANRAGGKGGDRGTLPFACAGTLRGGGARRLPLPLPTEAPRGTGVANGAGPPPRAWRAGRQTDAVVGRRLPPMGNFRSHFEHAPGQTPRGPRAGRDGHRRGRDTGQGPTACR